MGAKKFETLRSSFTQDGQRLFLLFEAERQSYFIVTRWMFLTSFDNIQDACDAFEAVEMIEGDPRRAAKLAKTEIARVPRNRFYKPSGMGRISYLINCIERRRAGLRPIHTGSKGSVEAWIPVRAATINPAGRVSASTITHVDC